MQATASFPSSVLVIDDEPVVLDLFQRALAEKGLSIRTAKNADEALALLEREGFGCVLTDKNLPGLDGIEIVRRGPPPGRGARGGALPASRSSRGAARAASGVPPVPRS